MFYNCKSLISLPDISNLSYMLKNCELLLNFLNDDDIENFTEKESKEKEENKILFDFVNTVDESDHPMLKNLKEILPSEIPKIEEENSNSSSLSYLNNNLIFLKENYSNFKGMFYNCKSLISLPDISKWNTNNVIDISEMFYNCSSLESLPDISKWNTNNVIDMSSLFFNCNLLKSLPDISKWNTNKVINISRMFFLCSSLMPLPDISK